MSPGPGQAYLEARSAAGGLTGREGPAVVAYDVAGDGEAEARAAVVTAAGLVEADEALEDPLPVGRFDSVAVVGDGEDDVVAVAGERDRDGRGGVPLGVVEEVAEDAEELVPAAADLRRRLLGRDVGVP
jgi:hypothetical protein